MLSPGDAVFYRFHPKFGFWGIPDMEREVFFKQRRDVAIPVRHNGEGNRDRPFVKGRMENGILCIGGSHTWAVGVDQDSRYSEHLERLTGRTVLNIGHCSLGLDQITLVILEMADHYRPDVIIVEQYPWAIHRVLSPYVIGYTRPYFYLDGAGNLKLQKLPYLSRFSLCRRIQGAYYEYRKELREYKAGIQIKEGYNPWTDPIFLYWKISYYDYLYALVDKIVGVMQDFCRQKGIRLLFGLGAVMQQFGGKHLSVLIDYDLPRRRLVSVLEKNRVAFVDMKTPMLGSHTPEGPVIFDDGHMNAKGHRIFAEELHRDMVRRGWLQ